jgi:hypothetical protein
MTNLISICILCIGLLALVLLVWRRDRARETEDFLSESEGPENVARLPERGLLYRCLSPEDLEFITRRKSRRLEELFVRERRRLAICWLRQTRREASRLYGLHLRSARHAANLRPAAELNLFFAVALFLIVYEAMLGAVWLYGPFQARQFLAFLHSLGDLLSRLGVRIAGSITPAPWPELRAAGSR